MFADLKGSTALIEGLDPEEARTILDPALQLMMDAVHQYDGFVTQALENGIFALFGAPLAHEDHPQRTLYAALRMQDTMQRYADTLRQQGYPPLLMQVGLNTGEVVLRSIRKDDLHAEVMGYPEQAQKHRDDAIALAHALLDPQSRVFALCYAATLHRLRREESAAQERAAAMIALCHQHGFPYDLAWGTILHGWALAEQGQGEAGRDQLQEGLAVWRATGAEIHRPYFLALLAEAYERGEQVDEGLATVAEALAIVSNTGERFYEAELYRLKGELTLQLGARDLGLETGPPSAQVSSLEPLVSSETEAEACFLKAIEIAQRQQAKSLELRAVMSLARLWQQQGKTTEAHRILLEIYNWFTEGFDTKDLQEAKALLDELS